MLTGHGQVGFTVWLAKKIVGALAGEWAHFPGIESEGIRECVGKLGFVDHLNFTGINDCVILTEFKGDFHD